MSRDFTGSPADPSNDPYVYETFTRSSTGFSAETAPGTDAQFLGGKTRATGLIDLDFDGITEIVFQVVFFNSKANKFLPGPIVTKTPTDEPEKIDQLGRPMGIIVLSLTGSGEVTFYYTATDRRLGGN